MRGLLLDVAGGRSEVCRLFAITCIFLVDQEVKGVLIVFIHDSRSGKLYARTSLIQLCYARVHTRHVVFYQQKEPAIQSFRHV